MPPEPVNFETARNRKRDISDSLINRLIDNKLTKSNGEAAFVKTYMDNVPRDTSDDEFLSDVEARINFHDDLARVIARNIKFSGTDPTNTRQTELLDKLLTSYKAKLEEGSERTANYFHTRDRGERGKYDEGALTYQGLSFQPKDRPRVFFLDSEQIAGVRSNFTIQREITGTFVHFSSDDYLEKRTKGEAPQLTERIYLNPRSKDLIGIYEKTFNFAKENDIPMKAKVWDRSIEPLTGPNVDVRADAIVIYVSEADADRVLGFVKKVHDANPDAFKGRKTPKIPMRIADGVAIGSEPSVQGESLTSHRSQLLEDVAEQTREVYRKDSTIDKAKVFRDLLRTAAIDANVNPDNLSFNLRHK